MKFRVYWQTNQSNGSTDIEASGSRDAKDILGKRMPHAKITRAERI